MRKDTAYHRGLLAVSEFEHSDFSSSLDSLRSQLLQSLTDTKKDTNPCRICVPFCDPDATRTHDRLLRRQMLYPAELPDRP